jgi:hypothetical protein
MTTKELLERINSVDFETGLVASTPRVLRQMLLRCEEVRKLRDAYDAGCLPDEQIRSFVDRLLREGAASSRFPHQTALAAIAVMLESRFSQFADEYLNDLARIRSDRFSIAARVARECLDTRATRIGTDVRHFPPLGPIIMTYNWIEPADSDNGNSAPHKADVYDSFPVT